MSVFALVTIGAVANRGRAAVTAPTDLRLHYAIFFAGIESLSIDADTSLAPERYRLDVHISTEGPAHLLIPWSSRSESYGVVARDELRPSFHRIEGTLRSKVRQVEVEYGEAGHVKRLHVTPCASEDERDEVPPELREGVDPLTAVASIVHRVQVGEGCTGIVPVFDGRRRYDLVLTDLGEQEFEPSSRDVYHGRAKLCRATMRQIAGFWAPDRKQRDSPSEIDAWLAPPLPGAPPLPVRLRSVGRLGATDVYLRAVEPRG